MSSRDRSPDEARPLPTGRWAPDDEVWDDQPFEVDTRQAAGAAPAGGDAFTVDTRDARDGRTGRGGARSAVRSPQRAARRAPAGTLFPEDEGYAAPAPRRSRGPAPERRPDGPVGPGGPGPGGPGGRGGDGRPGGRRTRRRRLLRTGTALVVLLLLAYVAVEAWIPWNAWNHVQRVADAPAGDRPTDTAGRNYLLVGSDGREGLTQAQQQQLNAQGGDIGQRTDSIIMVHVPDGGGKAALISFPRDSYVPIPGYKSNKINASFAFGGPKLLEATIEQNTGIHVDGYLEIGFAGFAGVVDSLGGVEVCVPFDMKDQYAAIDLKKGCQTLSGPTALGYVRARHSDPRGDIGRADRQRQFLGAIMHKALTPSTVLVPWKEKAFADASAKGLYVGQDTGPTDVLAILQALRGVDGGDTLSLVVPIATESYQTSNAGIAVKWDTEKAKALFTMIKNDEPLTVAPSGTTSNE
ncbi:LCP family protein [Lapillicoccus jejuensis]|uniref:LytR family transcriptional attenuator n=1 Tax=Lapillicoccus jejuensis TaxID=402171 RepID=A0A542E2G7_9MICO|nr:LCP family protein [Lapillicoccus jejuensis]TQJ09515.1 LytR family transcriptional attenuator [Lapillicoccus jejuensis]